MDRQTFLRVLQSFADKPCNVDDKGNTVTAIIQGDILELTFKQKHGNLYCCENGIDFLPGNWVVERLAKLSSLAQAIIDRYPEDSRLIPTIAEFSDILEKSPEEEPVEVQNAMETLQESIEDKPSGITHIVYLTSKAGEGKTKIIEAFARKQAERFLKKEAVPLVLPIPLAGQALISLDNIIIGTLVNQLRFPFFFIDSIYELMKLDLIVLALDGFEEMFTQRQTGGYSTLGSLVNRLDSSGRIIVAARTACYHDENLDEQSRMKASLGNSNFSFSEIHLKPWKKTQFVAFADKLALTENEALKIYSTISTILTDSHPLLTRPVLARRLLEEYSQNINTEAFLNQLKNANPEKYFEQFVSALLVREANEKWITEQKPIRPLMTVEEHHLLLMRIAEEMWINGCTYLNEDSLALTAELVAQEELRKTTDIVRPIINHVKSHVLLKCINYQQKLFGFDHEDFMNFYIGRLIGLHLLEINNVSGQNTLRRLLEIAALPELSVRVAIALMTSCDRKIPEKWDEILSNMALAGSRSSFLRENVSNVSIALSAVKPINDRCVLSNLLIAGELHVNVNKVTFINCEFEDIDFSESTLNEVEFKECTITSIKIKHDSKVKYDVLLRDMNLPSKLILKNKEEIVYYAPNVIQSQLSNAGFRFNDGNPVKESKTPFKEDERIRMTIRCLRSFGRSNGINENVFHAKFGAKWGIFESTVLSVLLINHILREVDYHGGGNQRRFVLHADSSKAETARSKCDNDFDKFIRLMVS